MQDKDAEAVITFIYDHLDPRYKTPSRTLPTAWPLHRERAARSNGDVHAR